MMEYIFVAILGNRYHGRMEETDNEVLAVVGDKTDADIAAT